jgi:signal transduction histidine kinase
MLLLTATLGWLGWQLLRQDRELAAKRIADQRDTGADLAVAALKARISAVEKDLAGILAGPDAIAKLAPAEGAVFVEFLPTGIRAWPEGRLIYYPESSQDECEASDVKCQQEIPGPTTRHPTPTELLQLAAKQRQDGKIEEALKTYGQIVNLGGVPLSGRPAALIGELGILEVLGEKQDRAALTAAATALDHDLHSGRWQISQAVYDSLLSHVRRVLPQADETNRPRIALAEGVYSLWEQWNHDHSLNGGQSSKFTDAGSLLLLWRSSGNNVAVFAANAPYLETEWLSELKPKLNERSVRVGLMDAEHRTVLGDAPAEGVPTTNKLDAELPWTVQAFSAGGDEAAGHSRMLLWSGMGVLIVLILTGAWFIGHAVARELAVARLQSDFVSAVSHEFRTPLTTLCQLSELLKRDRVASDLDRRQYYELMLHESNRLRRLVESLLNFGRLESGQLQFRFEKLDAAALVRASAEEFAQERQARGYRFEVETASESADVKADRETLHCVLWNLFENAVKYSPGQDTVWVNLGRSNGRVEIAVRDMGVGIPLSEQRRVFEKFVRGAAAKASDIRGTGIGLAMARQIVRAHGGDIMLESEPGKGSTFRVVLPAV